MTDIANPKPHVSNLYRYLGDSWAEEAHELALALSNDPDNLGLHMTLANTYTQLEWFEQALKEFDEVLRLDPSSDFVFATRGLVRGYLDDYKGAMIDFERCLSINPECAPAYFNRARVRVMMQDWEDAIGDYTATLIREPGYRQARWGRAEIYGLIGKRAEALADYEAVINTAPDASLRQKLWQEVYTLGLLTQ